MNAPQRSRWATSAAKLAVAVPRERLHPRVLEWAERTRRQRRPWAVAFSGGGDSLALLLLLWAHWPERRPRLVALHFNHRLRGRAATADARFCAAVCRGLGIGFRTGEWAGGRPGASEATARAARFEFLHREMQDLRAGALWLGHQQDDIAETLLMRLARGSGTAGLAALRPVQVVSGRLHLRPLLTLSRAELEVAMRASGARWREDASNLAPDYFRNRLRQDVVPAWQAAARRNALAGAALSRERLEEDDAALEAWLDQLDPIDDAGVLHRARLEGNPLALWRRALHRWLLRHPHESDLSRHGFEDLLSKVRAGVVTRFSLGSRGFARVSAAHVLFETPASARQHSLTPGAGSPR